LEFVVLNTRALSKPTLVIKCHSLVVCLITKMSDDSCIWCHAPVIPRQEAVEWYLFKMASQIGKCGGLIWWFFFKVSVDIKLNQRCKLVVTLNNQNSTLFQRYNFYVEFATLNLHWYYVVGTTLKTATLNIQPSQFKGDELLKGGIWNSWARPF
jgi:hypothetical protein